MYRGTKKEIREAMLFAINDTVITTFLLGSYLKLEICSGKDFENCETILFTDLVQFVECLYSHKDANGNYKFMVVN